MSANRRTIVIGVCAALAIVVIAFLATRPSSTPDAASTTDSTGPSPAGSTPSSVVPSTVPDSSVTPTDPAAPSTDTTGVVPVPDTSFDPLLDGPDGVEARNPIVPLTDLPSVVRVSNTSGMTDGQEININVVPESGSEIYGIEVRLCKAGTEIRNDYDFHPTEGGNCVLESLSERSDWHVQTFAEPPYQSVDLTFRAGVGTNRFAADDGRPVEITCGPGNPCVLAVKLQVPNGFGWQTYDVSYA